MVKQYFGCIDNIRSILSLAKSPPLKYLNLEYYIFNTIMQSFFFLPQLHMAGPNHDHPELKAEDNLQNMTMKVKRRKK